MHCISADMTVSSVVIDTPALYHWPHQTTNAEDSQ